MTEELKKIYASGTSNIILYDTIELSHPAFTQTYYLINANKPFDGKLENDTIVTFIPFGFEFTFPQKTDKGLTNVKIVLDATDREVLNNFYNYMDDQSGDTIKMRYRRYKSDSNEIQTSIPEYELFSVSFDYNQITVTSNPPDVVNKPFPFERYDLNRFKGLKYV